MSQALDFLVNISCFLCDNRLCKRYVETSGISNFFLYFIIEVSLNQHLYANVYCTWPTLNKLNKEKISHNKHFVPCSIALLSKMTLFSFLPSKNMSKITASLAFTGFLLAINLNNLAIVKDIIDHCIFREISDPEQGRMIGAVRVIPSII